MQAWQTAELPVTSVARRATSAPTAPTELFPRGAASAAAKDEEEEAAREAKEVAKVEEVAAEVEAARSVMSAARKGITPLTVAKPRFFKNSCKNARQPSKNPKMMRMRSSSILTTWCKKMHLPWPTCSTVAAWTPAARRTLWTPKPSRMRSTLTTLSPTPSALHEQARPCPHWAAPTLAFSRIPLF